jgi:thiol-disulfide isomerase/thioredoxin
VFLLALLLALTGASPAPAATPSPSASPSPVASASANPWDECLKSAALPYDRPLGLKLRALDGPDFDLMKYRGKAVLLNIFATWCGPCNHEMPALVTAARTYASRGLQVVSIDSRESDDAVRAFRKKYDITTPIAMDQNGGFTRALEVGAQRGTPVEYPVTLFIDPAGYLYCVRDGGMDDDQLTYRIERFLTATAAELATPSPQP